MAYYHEPTEELSESARDFHRALRSVVEELDAIDWYQQRVDRTPSAELRRVLEHNRDEEIEHACMLIEWLRRNMDGWDDKLKTYLFTEAEITALEDAAQEPAASGKRAGISTLKIGSLKG